MELGDGTYEARRLLRDEFSSQKILFARIALINRSEIRSGHGQTGRTGCYGLVYSAVVQLKPTKADDAVHTSIMVAVALYMRSYMYSAGTHYLLMRLALHVDRPASVLQLVLSYILYFCIHCCLSSFMI